MEAETVAPRWRRIAREVVPLVVLLAVCAKATANGWRAYDLMGTDEAVYAALAWHWGDPALPPPQQEPLYVPLYVLWYRALVLLPVEPVYLPNVSHGLLLTLLALLLYALARRLGAGRWVCATAAGVLVLNTRLAAVSPLPVHLATVLMALGVLAGTYRRSALGACGPVGFAVLAACYVRNEFGTVLLALLPVYLAFGLWACRRAEGRREFLPWAVPLLVAVGACAATLGIPLPDGPRGIFAFGQHYAYNVGQATGQGPELWARDFTGLVRADFGEVRSFGEAVRANPWAVAWHIGCNLDRLPNVALELLRPRMELADPYWRLAHWLIVGTVGVGLLCALRRVWLGGLRGPGGRALRAAAVGAVPVVMVGGASVVLIYPRDHYLVLPLFFALALAIGSLPRPRWPGWLGAPISGKARLVAGAAALLLLLATPTATDRWTLLRPLAQKSPPAPFLGLRETMLLLRSVPPRPNTGVLCQQAGTAINAIWMAPPVRLIGPDAKAEGFSEFVARHDVGVLILDHWVRTDPRFAPDHEFLALWDETDTGRFVVLKSPGGCRVAVRRDLLKRD